MSLKGLDFIHTGGGPGSRFSDYHPCNSTRNEIVQVVTSVLVTSQVGSFSQVTPQCTSPLRFRLRVLYVNLGPFVGPALQSRRSKIGTFMVRP